MLTTVVAAIAVVGGARYMISQSTPVRADPLAAAVVQAPSSHSVVLLEQQRQHIIAMSAATKSFKVVGTPKVAKVPVPVQTAAGSTGGTPVVSEPPPSPGTAKAIAYKLLPTFGFSASGQFGCVDQIFSRESGWRVNAANASGAYGIPQALPGSKMAQFGSDWMTNPATQIKWGIWYMKTRYGSPCNAWAFWQGHGWY
ncbi:MAG TPA: transglycosylase SLT domain-containing protein [Streptosporangiaceae bacterium]|nr:transglycosylase SLT domain-containing protein [Streptosporangiaceae bacterium]